jgi:hypothetical protein
MKMQELITEFRDEIPKLSKYHQETDSLYRKVWGLWDDYERCESEEGQKLLIDAARGLMNRLAAAFTNMSAVIKTLEGLNSGYTRKLGPRKVVPQEDPMQMRLALEQSPAVQADDANAAFSAGRHG